MAKQRKSNAGKVITEVRQHWRGIYTHVVKMERGGKEVTLAR